MHEDSKSEHRQAEKSDENHSLKTRPLVEARNLAKRYGKLEVVKGIHFRLKEGECFGFLGPNGAGKTSTVNMIYGYSPMTAGEITVMGRDIRKNLREIKAQIGVVSQENNLDPDLTVRANLMVYARYFDIPTKEAGRRADKLLEFMQLKEKAQAKITQISGGMKRRLVIARSLINRPRLLILDEPTTGLDPQARHLIWQNLRTLKRHGTTMILTTHYMEEAAQLCDRLVIMDMGTIVAQGSPRELVESHVGDDVIELRVDENQGGQILEFLNKYRFAHERVGDTLYLFSKSGEGLLQRVLEINGEDIIHRPATLEDVFLRLTGRELRD